MSRIARDEGYATVLAAVLILVLLAVAAGVFAVGQLVIVRQKAGTAADLAALSAASAAMAGASLDDACLSASRAAVVSRSELVDCALDEGGAAVTVRSRLPPLLVRLSGGLGDGWVQARARAGPP